jgi:hypothetical protein
VFGQHGPEAARPARHVEHRLGIAGRVQRAARQLDLAPGGQPPAQAGAVFFLVGAGMVAVVFVRKRQFGRRRGHGGGPSPGKGVKG